MRFYRVFFYKKSYKCYHPPTKRFFVSIDVTFVETKNYFPNCYLQGGTSFMEDKDGDLFLLDLLSFPSLENQNPLFLHCHPFLFLYQMS